MMFALCYPKSANTHLNSLYFNGKPVTLKLNTLKPVTLKPVILEPDTQVADTQVADNTQTISAHMCPSDINILHNIHKYNVVLQRIILS